jgi:hypothetical protein
LVWRPLLIKQLIEEELRKKQPAEQLVNEHALPALIAERRWRKVYLPAAG